MIGDVRRPTCATWKRLGPFGGPFLTWSEAGGPTFATCVRFLAFGGFVLMWVEVEDPVCATLKTAMPFLL